ncbi:hypothetical protein Leryth_012383 [Lithospermum erythrorhizon]|nr:hypothetical protein Leryth_012383 [Lithospermum erythrorhizon]
MYSVFNSVSAICFLQVAICVQCGDVGYDNAFVYCVNCLKFAIHRYCLPEIPKNFDEFVHWVCGDCEAVSLGCPFKKGLLNTQDDRCTEFDIFTSTSGSNKKNISQSSLGEDVSYGRTGSMLQSAHENLCSSGDARLADDCCLSLVEPNASNDWSRNENVPVKDGHQSDTSQQLDGVEEVKVAVDGSLQIINLGKKAEVSSSLLGKEKQRLPTTSDQKTIDGERQSDTSQYHGEEEAEVVADKLSKRTKFRKNTHISSSVSEEKKQRQTTSIHFSIAYQKKFEEDATSRFIPLHNEHQTGNSPRIQGVGTTQVVEGSSQKTNIPVMSQISSRVTQIEKQMRWSTSSNQCTSQQPKQFLNRLLIYPPLRNELKNHRSRSLVNIAKQRYYGRSHEARRSMHNSVREREKDHAKKESLVIPSRSCVNEEVSQHTHEARRPMHNTVREEDRQHAKEESLVNPTRSNVNEDVSRKTHEARRHMHSTICERYEDRVEEESLVIPSRSEVIDVDSHCPIITLPIAGPSGYNLQVQPVVDPIWRGRFDIVNRKDEKFEGFVAHLSNTACQQVIEEARLLPTLLQLEMVPKSTVWPKSFQTGQPSDDNIALYIFPADTRYEKIFTRLVDDMSRHELAMKAITKNAELLIFSSKELKLQYWRFQNKYYIWGVFKGKRS